MSTRAPGNALFVDLYELTMAAAYYETKCTEEATFSLFVRNNPERNYLVAAGLSDALEELAAWRFSKEDVAYLESLDLFGGDFLEYLADLRFTGHVLAMPEGTVFFADEPVLELTAPLIEAQIVETALINTIGFQSLIASKAARCTHAARGRLLVDFSLRRTQGLDAGMNVARSTHIVGFAATSNVLAGRRYGIPVSGTMAHSYVQAFEREIDAFIAFAETFPENAVLLIDTYDTLDGARNTVSAARQLHSKGISLKGVRIDSGDMAGLSREVRKILDSGGLADVHIFASSGFDERKIEAVLDDGARIDAFGVGTKLGVSADAPYLDMVYKLVRFGGRNVRKLSPGKQTLAGEKQVYRRIDADGVFQEDVIGLRNEKIEGVAPLLETVMENGVPTGTGPSLNGIRERFRNQFDAVPEPCKSLGAKVDYPVRVSDRLAALQAELDAEGTSGA